MNNTINAVNLTTNDKNVRKFSDMLLRNSTSKFKATFVKRDGKTIREMCFVPNTEWNKLVGKKGCEIGRKIVRTKVQRGMIGVTEMIADGDTFKVQPRTINLKTCTSLIMM